MILVKKGPAFIPGVPIIYPEPLPHWIYTAVPVPFQDGDMIEGEMVYDIIVGTILSAGRHKITATYIPVNQKKYRPCSLSYEVLVLKSPVVLVWNQPNGMTEVTC